MTIDILLEAQAAVAKVGKYATSESGDSVEMVERARGGFSIVVADGQRSGRSAKAISNLVVQRATHLLAEGVRDGAAARAAHDALLAQRGGQVSAELMIASVDLVTRTLVISRNSRVPGLLRTAGELFWLDAQSEAIGTQLNTKPAITEVLLAPRTTLLLCTDGVWAAGCRTGLSLNLPHLFESLDPDDQLDVQVLADEILTKAIQLDQGRPHDDATVVVLRIFERAPESTIRRMQIRFPL